MPGTQELTRRIKSVKSTRKVTRAMQMVSAAKMRKAQSANLASRTYSQLAWELIDNFASYAYENVLLRSFPKAQKIGIVAISTNRGLVGSFNTNLLAEIREIEKMETENIVELVIMGRKVKDAASRMKKTILAEFPKLDTTIHVENIYPIAKLISDNYASGNYKKILIVYNHFVSTLNQTPTVKQLLPLEAYSNESTGSIDIILEPSVSEVVDHILPRIVESQIYQAILESDASEHSARMVMMKNATEAAGDLIDDLTLTYNQLRQNKITTELSEITAGKIALEKN